MPMGHSIYMFVVCIQTGRSKSLRHRGATAPLATCEVSYSSIWPKERLAAPSTAAAACSSVISERITTSNPACYNAQTLQSATVFACTRSLPSLFALS